MPPTRKQVDKRIAKATDRNELPARMGRMDGTLTVPGKPYTIWVTLLDGSAVEALNMRVPVALGRMVRVGYDPVHFPNRRQVLSTWDVYPEAVWMGTPDHSTTQQWPASDTLYSRAEQLLPGLVTPVPGALSISIWPANFKTATGVKTYTSIQTVSFAASVPVSGARYSLLVADDTGTFTFRDGATVAGRSSLADVDIPEPLFGDSMICALKLYAGMTQLSKTDTVNDVVDLRFTQNPGATMTMIETIQQTGKWHGKTAMVWNILGKRAGFTSTTVLNDVKEFDNAVAAHPELSNSTLDIISDSVNDTNTAGTGVRQVKVVYLDATNVLTESAAINLNGTTLVTSVLTGVNAVLWMESVSAGSGLVADGNIRLRINGGTVEVEQITAGGDKSLSARGRIPAGYTGYLMSWSNQAIGLQMDMRLLAKVNALDRSLATAYHSVDVDYVPQNTESPRDLASAKLPALCDFKVSVIAGGTAGTNRCDTSFILALVAN